MSSLIDTPPLTISQRLRAIRYAMIAHETMPNKSAIYRAKFVVQGVARELMEAGFRDVEYLHWTDVTLKRCRLVVKDKGWQVVITFIEGPNGHPFDFVLDCTREGGAIHEVGYLRKDHGEKLIAAVRHFFWNGHLPANTAPF